jgi:hypothetical protein
LLDHRRSTRAQTRRGYVSRSNAIGGLLGLAMLTALCGACGGSTHRAAPPATTVAPASTTSTAPTTSTTIPAADTVVGMHFVQLRQAVTPVAARLQSGLSPAAISFKVGGEVGATVDAVVKADAPLLVDLRTLGAGKPLSAAVKAKIRTDVATWTSSANAAASILGVS